MQDTQIHILLGTDDRYLPGAVVTMASSIRATANDASFVFHVMDFGKGDFKIRILNDRKLVAHNMQEFLDAGVFYLRHEKPQADMRG